MLLISLRVRFAAAPMHAVLVGAVVPFAARHDDACAFGQGSDLSRRAGRIAWFRCCHSSSPVTGPTEGLGQALESLHTRSTRELLALARARGDDDPLSTCGPPWKAAVEP